MDDDDLERRLQALFAETAREAEPTLSGPQLRSAGAAPRRVQRVVAPLLAAAAVLLLALTPALLDTRHGHARREQPGRPVPTSSGAPAPPVASPTHSPTPTHGATPTAPPRTNPSRTDLPSTATPRASTTPGAPRPSTSPVTSSVPTAGVSVPSPTGTPSAPPRSAATNTG